MNPRANLASRLAFGLTGLGALAGMGAAFGQPAAPGAAATPAAPAYQDHYIAGGALKPDISSGEGDTSDAGELAHSLQIDGVVSALSSHSAGSSENLTENGFVARSQWETVAYGAWSLEASARAGGSGETEPGQGGVLALRQRGMPFDGAWQADNALGDINSPDIALAQFQPRFYLPTGSIQGAATEWHGPSDLQIVAGGGVPGLYGGIVVPDYRTLGGSTATAGAQWSPAAQWTVGGQVIEARDVNLEAGPALDGAALMTSTAELLSASWADHDERVQMNLINGSIGKGDAVGGWIDGSLARGRILQTAGLFRIDPNITWGNQLISSDAEGGYYRIGYQSRQWLWDAGIDEVRSVSGLGTNTTFLTGDTRYQVSRDWGVGTVANLSHSDGGNSWSLQGYVDHVDGWGIGRAQAEFAASPAEHDVTFTLQQNWSAATGIHLTAAASAERVTGSLLNGLAQDSTILGLAAYGGGQFTARLGADANARWARAVQGLAAPGVSVNVSLTYQIAPQWEALATYYENQVGSWTPLTVQSPLTPPVAIAVPSMQQRGIFLTLRYKRSGGAHFAPLGGAPGSGSGEITGVVYLDANDNGRFDAGEAGAANVTVVLDGRFSVQTDPSGRFSLPAVASGQHIITVVPDNLPLPWSVVNGGRTEVEVSTRERTDISIAARRPR